MHAKAQRFQELLDAHGEPGRVRELPDSARTAAEAAAALGTTVPEIAKSLVFLAGDTPVLVVASGGNRVDTALLAKLCDAEITRADAAAVRRITGFSIGGVPPFGHATPLRTVVDADLLGFATVWAAAGTPHAVFPIAPGRLVEIAGGEVAAVAVA
ncbi:YbaK/EbsC family protein [Nocardiopsis trehalosi]|uniref:YbaK/EbsC family protein n=1 Tax=Nocardiopsis trehalosi TaxID=109329 RepID=UPI0008311B20|nr:YbaK/EbsC family protein [Nocardiopsis trehalosi]